VCDKAPAANAAFKEKIKNWLYINALKCNIDLFSANNPRLTLVAEGFLYKVKCNKNVN